MFEEAEPLIRHFRLPEMRNPRLVFWKWKRTYPEVWQTMVEKAKTDPNFLVHIVSSDSSDICQQQFCLLISEGSRPER